MFHFCYLSVIGWDTLHVVLMVLNPGLAPLDPNIHSSEYLHQLQKANTSFRICSRCRIIERESGQFRNNGYCRTVDHCPWCDACVEGHDHHCKMIGKCIGKNNSRIYSVYLLFSILNSFSFLFSLMMTLGI